MITVVNKHHALYNDPTTIYCGRGSALGNPYKMHSEVDRNEVCDKYIKYFNHNVFVLEIPDMVAQVNLITYAARAGDGLPADQPGAYAHRAASYPAGRQRQLGLPDDDQPRHDPPHP